MNVDFNEIINFKFNFDNCDNMHEMGEIIRSIEESSDHPFLAVLKAAKEYYGKFRVAAVYRNKEIKICDKDDIDVLITNFPKEWKR